MIDQWTVSDSATPPPAAPGDWEVSDSPTPTKAAAPGPTFGSSLGDVASTVGSHLKGLVTGPVNAVMHPYDTFVKPTVDAVSQIKSGNSFEDNAEHAMDAIPVVGPWARNIENEAGQKGGLAAMAGLATDVGAPLAGSRFARALPNAMQDSAAGIINRTVGSRKADFARGANPGRGYIENGLGPAASMDSIAEKSAAAKNSVGSALSDAYDGATQNGKLIDADVVRKEIGKVIADAKGKAQGPGVMADPDVYDELSSTFQPAIANAFQKGGFTPNELWKIRKDMADSLNWGDQSKLNMTRTQQRIVGSLGKVLEDAVPESKELNRHYQDLSKLAGRAKERANTHSSPLTAMAGKGALTAAGAALGHATPVGSLGGAALGAALDSVPVKTGLASGLAAGSRFLRPVAPAIGAAAPAVTLGAVTGNTEPAEVSKYEKDKKHEDSLQETDTFDGKTAAGAQVPSEVTALLHRTGAKITNNEAPTSQSVASVSPDDPNTINIDDKERFDKDKNAANQTLSHEAVHIWHNNLPPEIQKMIPMDDPKDPYHGDGYEPDELKQMRSLGVKLWNLPRERAATIIQKYAHMGGDNAPKEIKEAYGPWAKDLIDSPLSTVQQTSANQPGINTAVRPPGAMQEKHVFGEYDTGPNKGKPVPGMMERGNIDVNHRPQIHNADGSMSSIFSVTVPLDKDGSPWNGAYEKAPKYALVPSIANGKFLTPDGNIPDEHDKNAMSALEDAATDHYSKTREHLGIFSSGSAADRYAGATHAWGNDGTDSKVYAPSYAGDSNLVINPGPQTAAPTGTPGGMLSPVPSAVPVPKPMQEMKIFGEGEGKPEKEDTPNGKREVLHGSKDRESLVEEAKAEAPHLEKGLKAVADQNKGAKFDAVRGEKSEGRLTEKIKREGQPVETVPDVLAGRIAVDSDEAKDAVVADLKKHTTVVREKDEFKSGDSRFGFHAHKLQVKVSPKLSAEVQVVPKETAAQDDKQHPIYKQARTAELDGDTGKAKELASKAKEMNDGAKSRFDLRNKEKEKDAKSAGDNASRSKELDSGDISKRKADADGIGRGVADHRRVDDAVQGGDRISSEPERTPRGDGDGRGSSDNGGDGVRGDKSHRVGDKVTLPNGKSATVAYAPSKSSQLPTYRFKDEDGKTVEMRARDAESKVKKAPDDVSGDIDVDLDSTLAHSDKGGARMHIGAPEQAMVDRIKKDIAAGKKVRIFTARVANDKDGKVREAIQAWSKKHLGVALDVTDKKLPGTGEILDDKAKQVKNGKVVNS